jgi:hypothetical protein
MSATNALPAARRRRVLEQLPRPRLQALTAHFGLKPRDRRVLDDLIDALLNAPDLDFRYVLRLYKRDELQLACDALGLDRGGREKELLVARILGQAAGAEAAPEPAVAEARPAPEKRAKREPRAAAKNGGGDLSGMTTSADAMGTALTPSASTTTSTSAPQEPIEEALKRLARRTPTALAGLLHDVESHVVVDGTQVTAHCHCLQLDGNGRPRTEDLVRVIAEHVLDYAIPRSQIREADEEYQRTKSTQKIVRLADEARSLFTDLEQSGEGGELLLFALAEEILQLPQLICKMSLKTNARMHVHGADGLHACAEPKTGKLLLYWGESKIYGDVTAAVRECLASIRPMLAEYSSGQRDLQLLQRHADLDAPALEAALKKYLDPDAAEFNSLEFRGLCLVGFDCDAYPPGPSPTQLAAVAKQIATTLPMWRSHVKKRITEEKLDSFAMHFLFVPFPSADNFRRLLRDKLGMAKPATAAAHVPAPTAPVVTAKPGRARRAPSIPVSRVTPSKSRTSKRKGTPSGAA